VSLRFGKICTVTSTQPFAPTPLRAALLQEKGLTGAIDEYKSNGG
jgi:hypothetical protein